MLTKYILTIGATEYPIPDECLKNWDEISFSLKRTDYSGVMRSFSTEFIFVGEIAERIFEAYRSAGFHAEASVTAYTYTNRRTWSERFTAPLDFSTLEVSDEGLTINALDNTLAALVKNKKSQKYEYPVADLTTEDIKIDRILINNYAAYTLPNTANAAGIVTAMRDDAASQVISTEYFELTDEVAEGDGAANSFFAVARKRGADLHLEMSGTVRCWLCPTKKGGAIGGEVPKSAVQVITITENDEGGNDRTVIATIVDDDIYPHLWHGSQVSWLVSGTLSTVYADVAALRAAAIARFGNLGSEVNGIFGVVGSVSDPSQSVYWTNNHVWEFRVESGWSDKGIALDYYQDRDIAGTMGRGLVTVPAQAVYIDTHIGLSATAAITIEASMMLRWSDPIRGTRICRGVTPLTLAQAIVGSISSTASVTIEADADGLLAKTWLIAGEELRLIDGAKYYTTFGDFAGWLSAVFGYTYRINGNRLTFLHRSEVFASGEPTEIARVRDVAYSVNDGLLYSTVEAGYGKKEYGEIDGRLETNFTNYYATGYAVTDKKLSLVSKYRSDGYGIEFTARKAEAETTDSSSDEAVFFVKAEEVDDVLTYAVGNNAAYLPSYCIATNEAYIAALGNGKAVTLEMTSSDGNNALSDVVIDAGTALFSAGELDFTTDSTDEPTDLNGLVAVEYGGYRYTGFISEATARYGKVNGMEYKLIVKTITKI